MKKHLDILEKTNAAPNKVYRTKKYQYWINSNGELCRALLASLNTMAMYDADSIEVIKI